MKSSTQGIKRWYVNGLLHRTDGPATIYPNGDEEWWINGKLHRTDGPAIIWPDGRQEWYLNGYIHRADGPAAIDADGTLEWWINGNNINTLVEKWLQTQQISFPFNDEEKTQFTLTFV